MGKNYSRFLFLRSNGRISYVDDMDDLIKIDPTEAAELGNEIRRKKRQHSNPTLVEEQTTVSSKKRSKVTSAENIENNIITTKAEKKKHSKKSKKYPISSIPPPFEGLPSEINTLEHAPSGEKSENNHSDAVISSMETNSEKEINFTENPERRPKRNQNIRINYVEDLDEVIKIEMDNR